MTSPGTSIRRAATGAPDRGDAADVLGTAGWAAKGVVYLLIGALALQLALTGGQEEEASKSGALQKLVEQPAGSVLLTVVVVGLVAYALYSLLSLFLPGARGAIAGGSGTSDKKAWGKDAKHVAAAVVYGVLAAQGVNILLGRSGGGGGENKEQTWSAVLLSSTPGTLVLGAVAVGALVFGGFQVRRGITRKFMKNLHCAPGRLITPSSVEWTGVAGHVARGVVAALIGVFILVSIVQHDPAQVRGLDGTLRTVQSGPFGLPLLVLVALGLGAYGLFSLISARCRRHEDG